MMGVGLEGIVARAGLIPDEDCFSEYAAVNTFILSFGFLRNLLSLPRCSSKS